MVCALHLVNLKSPSHSCDASHTVQPFIWARWEWTECEGELSVLEVTPHHGKMRPKTSVLCSGGDDQLLAAVLLSWVEVLILPPHPQQAADHFTAVIFVASVWTWWGALYFWAHALLRSSSCPDQTVAKPHTQTPQNESCLPARTSASHLTLHRAAELCGKRGRRPPQRTTTAYLLKRML